MNRLSGRALVAKVNQSERGAKNNLAFAQDDEIKAVDLTWTHYMQPDIPLKLNGWLSDSDANGNDAGVSVGIEFSLDRAWAAFR
ncbi:surface assembly of capsule domain protein [Acinetobacter sp. 1239920]|nr:surface assembly of capsule domain protein [Acinetobacter sp. 1239920]